MNRFLILLLVFLFEPALAIGDKNIEVDSGVVAINEGDGSITVTNIQGISEYAYQQVSNELSDVKEELGAKKFVINKLIQILELKKVPIEEREIKLFEIAKQYKELLKQIKALEGSDELEVEKLITQAKAALDRGEFNQAEALFDQASDLKLKAVIRKEKAAEKERISVAELRAISGNMALTQLKYSKAAEHFQKAADILPEKHVEILASYLNSAASAFYDAGEYTSAQSLYERALAIREKALDVEHPNIAIALNNLALLYAEQGKYKEALPLYEKALTISEKVLGIEHPVVATSLDNLAQLHLVQGRYEKSLPLFKRALAIKEKILGAEHPSVAISLNNLALFYQAQGKRQEALLLFKKALTINEKTLGAEHPQTANSFNNLGLLYYVQREYKKALFFFKRALAVTEKILGAEHPDIAKNLNNLALVYGVQGEYEKALSLCEKALKISRKKLGEKHPNTQIIFESYSTLLKEIEKSNKK